jgi:outer membrane protein assembly factor BamB
MSIGRNLVRHVFRSSRTFTGAAGARMWLLAALGVALLGVAVWMTWTWGRATARPNGSTKVVLVSPHDEATDVDVQAPVQIHFSNGLTLVTITAGSVRLVHSSGAPVPARLSSDIEGDVVTLQPTQRLLPRTSYVIEVNGNLIDKEGVAVVPFRSSFTTGDDVPPVTPQAGFRYTKTKVDDEHGPTAIAIGPDGNVYVSTYNGVFYRLRIDPKTGLSIGKEKLLTLRGRKILGLAFDPEATARNLIAWITYDDRKAEQVDTGTFSGVVSRALIPAAGQGGGR